MKHKFLSGILAGLLVAGLVWAAANYERSERFVFRNGITVEQGDSGSAAASITLPADALVTADLADGAVTFAKQAHVTIGAAPAATCTAGQMHIDTDQTDDTNCTTTADNALCYCVATDTWAANEP